MDFPKLVLVFPTKHAELRLRQRLKIGSFTEILPQKNVVIYQDKFKPKKYYYNLDAGFLVMKRVSNNRFIIKTVIDEGKIDDSKEPRHSEIIKNLRVLY